MLSRFIAATKGAWNIIRLLKALLVGFEAFYKELHGQAPKEETPE